MSTANAGWFPDPMGRHEFRYWTGRDWSEHVADAGHTTLDAMGPPVGHAAPAHADSHPLPPPTLTPVVPAASFAASPASQAHPTTPSAGGKKGDATWKIVAALAAVVALAAGGFFIFRGKDDGAKTVGNGAEIFLEPAAAVGADPFTPSVDTNTAPAPPRLVRTSADSTATTVLPTTVVPTTVLPVPAVTTVVATTVVATTVVATTVVATTPPTTAAPATVGVRSVEAASPGLYGGTRNNAACDKEQMISFLNVNPDKAAAWAGAQGIATADIPAFIRSLTPLVLRADTRVTNFGFRNGVANAKDAILQMGTAVLVDVYGIPRARCSCGNPLAPPRPLAAGYTYTGDPWPGFDPAAVIVVVNVTNIVINDFVITDLNGGYFGRTPSKQSPTGIDVDGDIYVDSLCDMWPEATECLPPVIEVPTTQPEPVPTTQPEPVPTTQPEPVLGTGDIQFTLRWSSTADLDLAVLDPNGEEISFVSPMSSSGGTLDVDSNASCDTAVTNPVENIFWPAGLSPIGLYTIQVRYYGECGAGAGPQAFTLTVLIDGVEVAVQPVATGLLRAGDSVNAPGDSRQYQLEKTAAPPIAAPPAAPPVETTPPPAPPVETTPPPVAPPVDTTRAPVAPPVVNAPVPVTPGQPVDIAAHCAQLYPGAVAGANLWYTLCMHDATVA